MRAAAGLDAHDALLRQRARHGQDARILLGVDVVGDGAEVVDVAEALAERLHQRRLAGADRTADADAQRTVRGWAHDRNSLVYCVSCRSDARSERKAQPPRSSRPAVSANAASVLDSRQKRRDHALAVGLADDAEPHGGRDEVRDEGEKESLKALVQRHAVARRHDADRDRIGDGIGPDAPEAVERGAGPGFCRGGHEGVALRRRLQPALGGVGERQGEFGAFSERFSIARQSRAIGSRRIGWRRCGPRHRRGGRTTSLPGSPHRSRLRPHAPIRVHANRRRRRPERPATARS